MENLDNNDLIEQYLSGELPPAELQTFEARMATDAEFRAEVELQRQLHEEFADQKKLQLRDLLSDMLKEPPPPPNNGWLKGAGIVLAVLLLGWLGWYWFSSAPENIQPAIKEEIKSPPPSNEPIATPENRDIPSDPTEQPQDHLIAQADPAAYVPNRIFETSLDRMIRSSDGAAEMASPVMGAKLKAENGMVKINFRGFAPADGDTAQFPLILKIFDNQATIDKSLFRILPTIGNRNETDGRWTFSSPQRLRLRPGLYYFTLERQSDEDLIFVGKFSVE